MQKLVISSQFMGVKPCIIKLNRFLLLIGEQASGKSTIAKLIFFFQTLPDSLYENGIIARSRNENFDFLEHINRITRQKFLETFGPTSRSDHFEIHFHYNDTSYLKINQGADKLTYALFEKNMGFGLGEALKKYFKAPRLDDNLDEINLRQQFKQDLDLLFKRETNTHTYLIAGRSTTVAFPDIFERVIEQEIEKLIEDEVKEQDFEKRQRTGNEKLLYQFVQWSKGVRNNFKNNGKTFQKVGRGLNNQVATTMIERISKKILKGTYQSEEWGEQIKLENNLNISLKDASSGQQEVLRILQGVFLSIGLTNRREFFVVEEPEAHLYPLAQKELMNAFGVFLNTIHHGKLIITTHSPYILACVNILLFAQYVTNQTNNQSKIVKIVQKEYWLDSQFFNAYSLGQSEDYCVDIKDAETGMIDQNYLDTISEQLGMQNSELYNLLLEQV
ncbi:AAA ATPase-like protein [Arcicella aurantiaca]|uniref:AAA ATPase-like protein n=1 Tax=Arcicella aurantiaca TaxID=591202 RepID=A0A316EBN5_9BACT|nr:AAA family ATPase [Arcicella aurantiaca]PWK27835.1 AAA ATPase-like protein [Arcicella aurantiaca]